LGTLDSGIVPTGTQFLIESLPKDFLAKSTFRLKGLNAAHVAAIESLQPFNGCKWTKQLAALSNLHKHNDLIIVSHQLIYNGWLNPIPAADPKISRYKVDVKFKQVLYIQFDGGTPLIETLKEIESQVSKTLDAFEPEFR
jgi:hypothetical protein